MQTSSARFRTIFIGILVAVSLFAGVMARTAGAALFPSMFRVAGPLICAGEIDIVSQSYSYKPGQRGVSRTVYRLDSVSRRSCTRSRKSDGSSVSKATTKSWSSSPTE